MVLNISVFIFRKTQQKLFRIWQTVLLEVSLWTTHFSGTPERC